MPLSEELLTKVSLLKKRLDDFQSEYESRDPEAAEEEHQQNAWPRQHWLDRLNRLDWRFADEGYEATRDNNEKFLAILKDTCALIREAESSKLGDFPELLQATQEILSQGVSFAYGDADLFEFLPSWAHDNERGEPLIKDRGETELPFLSQGAVPAFLAFLKKWGGEANEGRSPKLKPDPWNKSMKRHPKTSLLARFRPDLPTLTATQANPLAMSVYDARCEITSSGINSPIGLQLTRGNSCLAMNAMGGYKNRSPVLGYFILDEDTSGLPYEHSLKVGLADIAYQMALDESRCLIFLGDEDRIKSYAWGIPGGDNYEKPLATHTLKSRGAEGPITALPNGTVVRAGEGSAFVWNLGGLQTHGENPIGEEIEVEDTWRDDPDEIEKSSGSQPTSQLTFVDNPNLKPSEWLPLIQSPSSMLCTTSTMESTGSDYDCFVLDLEHGGKVATRFLGHGGIVSGFSVSASDPHIFLSACNDGFARMYDVRRPLPVVTIDAAFGQSEFCDAVALAHPDGIPTVFTGTEKAEQIKVWDVRARTPVYELATGNNGVTALAWDSKHSSLYAATETSYMDRLGYHHDYRPAKIPNPAKKSQPSSSTHKNEDIEDGDDDDYDSHGRCWPKGAWHSEDHFGYAFDAGEHRIYRYQFKEDPNPRMLPVYGQARMGGNYW